TPSAQANQKWELTMASGDLPDIMPLSQKDFVQLSQAGQLADLTEVYEQYASPALRAIVEANDGFGLQSSTVNGKLLAIPHYIGSQEQAHLIWIRTDWMENLNLTPPKTMDDLIRIAEAFA